MVDFARYLERVGAEHRRALGQFVTPAPVARFMVEWVLSGNRRALFDPAFGLGAFHDQLDGADVPFHGNEIDREALAFWSEFASAKQNTKIANEDYLLSWGTSHTNIVCNPPYMRFQKFLHRKAVSKAFLRHLNLPLPGYMNAASAFLLKSLAELDGKGRLAYVMPLEFLNTGYGTVVKRRLVEGGHLVAIIKLDCERETFPDAVTSAGIILYDASRRYSSVAFHCVKSLSALAGVLDTAPVVRMDARALDAESKWLSHFEARSFSVAAELSTPLFHYGRFSRGIATGANQFFVLRPSRARELGVDATECVPCIARGAQIRGPVFGAREHGVLAAADAPVLLFSASGRPSAGAARYIRNGERLGFHKRFLTKSRRPWYKTESRQPAPLLLGVFSRGGYKVVRNSSDALHLTCFHGFQPNVFGMAHIDRLFLYLLSSAGREILSLSRWRYGDALDKFEPNDLNGAAVPSPGVLEELSPEAVMRAMAHVAEAGEVPASVDSHFARLKAASDAMDGSGPRRHVA